ncbi:MAG: ATP-binding cassette domain-containing protein [Caldilineaceae bacterium]
MSLPVTPTLLTAAWPVERLAEALQQLAHQAGLLATHTFDPATYLPPPQDDASGNALGLAGWLDGVAAQMALEVEPVQSSHSTLPALLQSAAPALLRLPSIAGSAETFLLLLKGGPRYVTLLTPRLAYRRIRLAVVITALSDEVVAPQVTQLTPILTAAGLPPDRQLQVARTILAESAGAIQLCWLLRAPPTGSRWRQLRQAGLVAPGAALLGGYVAQLGLTLLAWGLIGRSAITGTLEPAWIGAWALLLLTALVVQAWAGNAQAHVALGMGAWFKQRLFAGALQLATEPMRRQGAGHFLSRVLDAESVEQLGVAGGFWALLALLQLGSAALILRLGAGGWAHPLLLVGWIGILLAVGWLSLRRQQVWHESYRTMTSDLVERMVAQRTRLVQEAPTHWHQGEDTALATYLQQSVAAEQLRLVAALIPRGWMVTALAALFAILLSMPVTATQVAISLGGMLLALQAFSSCVTGLQSLIGARIAWQQVAPMLPTTANSPTLPAAANPFVGRPAEPGQPVLLAQDLRFHYSFPEKFRTTSPAGSMGQNFSEDRYQVGGNPVLRGCTLQICQGDRLLLEGPSGGGKSTLAALLGGLQTPTGGLLLWRGFDYQTLGATAWRRQIVVVPQFHENHILTGTLAFNLLMGRRWPPLPADLVVAEELCRELGLGPLLDRMPAGLQQLVGESGWQLSHGERSRLYLARALLQQAELIILDESFAALDAATAQCVFACLARRAPTLLVIAHP